MRLASSRMRRALQASLAPAPACLRGVFCGHCGVRVTLEASGRYFATTGGRPPSGRPYSTSASSSTTGLLPEEPSAHDGTRYKTHVLGHLKRRGPFLPAVKPGDTALPFAGAPLQPRSAEYHHDKLVVSADHYGKWSELLFDYDRLMFESGLSSEPPVSQQRPQQTAQRAVDDPNHATDMSLWSAIFNFAQRRGGSRDALVVWQAIVQRKQLHQVAGPVARVFWESVLAAALDSHSHGDDHGAFLDTTWAYAEWMLATHDVLWPGFYQTVVTHFLEAGEYDSAVRWHVRLSAHFGLAKRPFFAMLKGFLLSGDGGGEGGGDGGADEQRLHQALQHIYATSRHRSLYDTIVPLLWSRGNSAMARAWRETLAAHGDLPASNASRPFLQFLRGYYPETVLYPQEEAILQRKLDSDAAAAAVGHHGIGTRAVPGPHANIYHLMNQVHGETFGIKEKKVLDDKMGSKWFATKFVSLDTAINLLYTLGISEIGPLSLQSLALREGAPAGVLHRLEQLEQCQISIGRSSYAAAIRHLARTGEAETLRELLQSMIEPAVFDDIVLQRQVMGMAAFKGDWKTYRMILVVRVAASYASIGTSSNRVLLTCLERGKKAMVLKLLDEFAAREYEIFPATCQAINAHIIQHTMPIVDHRTRPPPDVDFYAALCRRMAAMRLPVATLAWRNLLYILGRSGRLYKTENTALGIVQSYLLLQQSRAVGKPLAAAAAASAASAAPAPAPATTASALSDETSAFKVHVSDVPEVVRGDDKPPDEDIGYRLLPRDLPRSHPLHPLALIFEEKLVRSIVRWYFHRMGAYRHGKKTPLKLPVPKVPEAPEAPEAQVSEILEVPEAPETAETTEMTEPTELSEPTEVLETLEVPEAPESTVVSNALQPTETPVPKPTETPEPVETSPPPPPPGTTKKPTKKSKPKRPRLPKKEPVDYSFAAGIRLLAMLRDRGVDVPTASVRAEALLCILAIFGPASTVSRVWKPARAMNQATLGEVKSLCDAAWSDSTSTHRLRQAAATETLLPPVATIEAALEAIAPGSASFASQISKPGAKGDQRRESQDMFFSVVEQPERGRSEQPEPEPEQPEQSEAGQHYEYGSD